ncbi:hypothetical protein A2U01_0111204, partial [Trifolium medium]|nr:hypothetical protein [Trifolium medium]
GTNIPPWGRGWRQKLPRKHFGTGKLPPHIPRPVDIPTISHEPSIRGIPSERPPARQVPGGST